MTQGASNEATYIPMPDIHSDLPGLQRTASDDLVRSGSAESVGQIENKAGFSAPLQTPSNGLVNFFVKAPGTGFYVPPAYAQFVPPLNQMIAHYYSKQGDDGYCCLGVFQGIVSPKEGARRPYMEAHKDFIVQDDNGMPGKQIILDQRTYIVSDCLPTGFSDATLSADDVKKIRTVEIPDKLLGEILNRPGTEYKPTEPHMIMVFDSKVAHALANPEEPTHRTVLTAIFSGPELNAPKAFNNPWLDAAVKEQQTHFQNFPDRPDNHPFAPRVQQSMQARR
jgi:hypothetical protein